MTRSLGIFALRASSFIWARKGIEVRKLSHTPIGCRRLGSSVAIPSPLMTIGPVDPAMTRSTSHDPARFGVDCCWDEGVL